MRATLLPSSAFWRAAAVALGVFAVVWGAKLAVIDRFGSDLPQTDQWDGEGATLFLPWLQGRLEPADLFAPHNEHRIACTRLLALGLLAANGQWDARLECVVNAALHAALAVAVFFFGASMLAGRWRDAWLLVVVAWFASPVSWNNVIAGFHSQQVFLLGFSLAALALLLTTRAGAWRWWLGIACVVLALFSMSSGVLAAAVVAVALVAKRPPRGQWWRDGATLVACLSIAAAGAMLTVEVAQHAPLRAHGAGDSLGTFGRNLLWPVKLLPLPGAFLAAGLLAWAPWARLAWRVLRGGAAADARERVVVAAGLWVLAQAAATAWARGAGMPWPASRYVDTIAVGVGVNLLALFRLSATGAWSRTALQGAKISTATGAAGLALVIAGLAIHAGINVVSALPAAHARLQQREATVRAYLATGDRAALVGEEIPYPGVDDLVERLSHPEIRGILPASVRPGAAPGPLSRAAAQAARGGLAIVALGVGFIVAARLRFTRRAG